MLFRSSTVQGHVVSIQNYISTGVTGTTVNPIPAQTGNYDVQALVYQNLDFLAAEVTAYVSSIYPAPQYVYDTALCQRDVGIILGCVLSDVLDGVSFNSKLAGNSYWRGKQSVISGQVGPTMAALSYLSRLLRSVVTNTVVASPYQVLVTQVIDTNYTNGSLFLPQTLAAINAIISILENGAVNYQLPSPGLANAQDLIIANMAFIKAEVTAYVQSPTFATKYPGWSLTPIQLAKCTRDVGLIVGSVMNDVIEGGTTNSEMAGKAYRSEEHTSELQSH